MAQTDWALGTALASAAIALVALLFSAKAALTQAKAADFNNCLEVVKQLAEAQRRVRDAKDEAEKHFEFRELFNLLEALAKLANDRKLQSSTRDYVEHFLIEAWACSGALSEGRFVRSSEEDGAGTSSAVGLIRNQAA